MTFSLDWIITYFLILLISFPIHEFSHAWVANYFGDPTPEMNGRLTLNPLAHLDFLGALILFVGRFGWAKPVPINPYALNRRSPSAVMWVSLAGPMSNLIMAILAAIPFKMGWVSLSDVAYGSANSSFSNFPSAAGILYTFIYVNLLLMLFNLIPLAPLDGEKIAAYFFPPSWSRYLEMIQPYGPIILLALVFLGGLNWIIRTPMLYLLKALVG